MTLARSNFRKGGNFTAAMAFEFGSTNLVVELGVILAVLMGWQFTLAEFTGEVLSQLSKIDPAAAAQISEREGWPLDP